jgi:ATP-dependent protease ClpP protease subunit
MHISDNLAKKYSILKGQTQDTIVKDLDRENFFSPTSS